MNFLLKTGQFLRLIDENGQLSLTNASVYVSLYRLLTVPHASYTEVGTFFLAAVAYNFKKTLGNSANGSNSNGQ